MQKLINQFNSYLKYFVTAFLLIIPLYPKFPFIKIPFTYVSIRFEDFLLAILALVVLTNFAPKIKEFIKKPLERSISLYLLVGLFSLCSAIFLTKSVTSSVAILHWLRRIEYFIPFFVALITFNKDKDRFLEYVIKVFTLTIFIIFIYGFGQKYFSWPVIITQNQEYSKGIALRWVQGSHINSTFAGHYDLASFLVLLLPIFVNLFVLLKSKKEKIVFGLIISFGYWLLTNSISRISVVSMLFGVSLSLFILKKYKEIAIFLVISLIAFGFSSALRARYLRVIQVSVAKIRQIILIPTKTVFALEDVVQEERQEEVFEDRSSSIRLNVEWPRAIRALSKNPFLGTGYSSITLATDNDYLRLFGEVGIIGFLAFMLIIFIIGSNIVKIIPSISTLPTVEKAFIAGFAGGFFGILINAIFIDVFEASKFATIFWFITGVFTHIYRKYEQNN
ncbi:O-antigen ligase family protein [Patescibacteria group bacterium]|nr:O-antigen ligase family protein [Patescibacteria group bacterium]